MEDSKIHQITTQKIQLNQYNEYTVMSFISVSHREDQSSCYEIGGIAIAYVWRYKLVRLG